MKRMGIIVSWLIVMRGMGIPVVWAAGERPTISLTPTIAVKKESIPDTGGKDAIYRLESVIERQGEIRWNGLNSFRVAVSLAVERGVAANTIVLLLLLPLVATIVGLLHYGVGLSGYGIFMPTMVAVTMLATGVLGGLGLFASILGVSLTSNWVLRRWKLHFWPARSINLVFICVATFGLMVGSSYFQIVDLSKISIFPMLFMILLVEEFTRTQLIKSKKEAVNLTLGTLVLAVMGVVVMNIRGVQEWVLLNPELLLLIVLIANVLIGNYGGIRLMEIKRFRGAIRKKK